MWKAGRRLAAVCGCGPELGVSLCELGLFVEGIPDLVSPLSKDYLTGRPSCSKLFSLWGRLRSCLGSWLAVVGDPSEHSPVTVR